MAFMSIRWLGQDWSSVRRPWTNLEGQGCLDKEIAELKSAEGLHNN